MKKLITLCFLAIISFVSKAQQNPVSWTATYKTISATEGEIVIVAAIEKNWHIYSQDASNNGPVPTSFIFEKNKSYQLNGKAEEIGAHEIFDKAFDAKISSFSEKAEFRQKIKITGKTGFVIPIKVEFMCCNDMMCLPPKTIDLTVKVQ